MYWLTRPPYWRWLAAGVVIAVAGYMDLSGPPTEEYPFVRATIDAGAPVEVEWRQVATGLLPPPAELPGIARARLEAGTPLVDGLLAVPGTAPPDWWAVPAEIPSHATIGSSVLVAMREPNVEVLGIVVAPSAPSTFGGTTPGLLAVAPEHAAEVAMALAQRRATLLVQP